MFIGMKNERKNNKKKKGRKKLSQILLGELITELIQFFGILVETSGVILSLKSVIFVEKTGVLGTNTDLLQSTDKYISYSCIEYSSVRAGIERPNLSSDRYRGHTKTTIHKRVHDMLYFISKLTCTRINGCVSDCCLMQIKQLSRYIMATKCYI